ncbi:hypothetical protein [Rhizobium sullae]|nr:hypothetical protein [Rhizobium sullae]
MKHGELRSIVHNVADSLASGVGLLIGVYEMDVFREASCSPGRVITVDFLRGEVIEGEVSSSLAGAVARYRAALDQLCRNSGGSVDALREARVRYWSDHITPLFSVTIEDSAGRRSTTEYAGIPGKRVKAMDELGRLRPKASAR